MERLEQYAQHHGLSLQERLGFGVHGSVYSVIRQDVVGRSAVKVHDREDSYLRERDVYLRLRDEQVTQVCGVNVPQLLDFDDELWIIDMSVVSKPFALDFAGAYLDERPDFSEEVLAEWRAAKAEQFGTDWPKVNTILWALQRQGIHLMDVNPNNIALDDPMSQ